MRMIMQRSVPADIRAQKVPQIALRRQAIGHREPCQSATAGRVLLAGGAPFALFCVLTAY